MDRPVKSFSVGFEETEHNELPFARMIAQRFHTVHCEQIIKPDILEILPMLVWHYDEPFADSSAIPSFYIAGVARQEVKAVLNGDGGDEAFGGYDKYAISVLARGFARLPMAVQRQVRGGLEKGILRAHDEPYVLYRLRRKLWKALLPDRRCLLYPEFFDARMKNQLYLRPLAEAIEKAERTVFLPLWEEATARNRDVLDVMLELDFNFYLPGDLMVKMDLASMAHSLEARSPFLDHELLEFSASLPWNLKVRGKTRKYLLKETLRGFLPEEIIRRRKRGFSLPLRRWLREPLRPFARAILIEGPRGLPEFFSRDTVRLLLESHWSGRANHSSRIWALLMFELWYRTYIERGSAVQPIKPWTSPAALFYGGAGRE